MAKSEFLKIFKERGFFHQCTDENGLDKLLSEEPVTAYIGFDCTATSLHVGSLMQIMVLRWLQKLGHNPIVLIGGGTTKIGDPSFRDESRPLLDEAGVARNAEGIKKTLSQFIDFNEVSVERSNSNKAIMVNNDDWLSGLNYMNFLRDYGRHFSVNKMLSFDSVKLRLEREQHLSFLEFNYMILQAYDFVELSRKYNCRLQIGGSDQWGNIVNGVELGRRLHTGEEIFGLTTPLITTSSGAKMGKTASGAVWLSSDMLSPYDYWQFWRNTEDKDVWKFMRLFTEISIDEIASMENEMQGAAINDAKIILANEATKICHGADAASHAYETAKKVFEQGGVGDDLPVVVIPQAELEAGIPTFKIFQTAGLAESGGDAKRLIKGGGAKVNDIKVESEAQVISISDLKDGAIKLSAGKKKHALVKVG